RRAAGRSSEQRRRAGAVNSGGFVRLGFHFVLYEVVAVNFKGGYEMSFFVEDDEIDGCGVMAEDDDDDGDGE
ncbi:hypothetical protein Tco_0068252, partial [Tanacetum coccineum]